MNKSIQVLVVTALVCTGVLGCQPAGKDASKDTTTGQTKAPPASVTMPVDSTAAPTTAAEPQVKTKAQSPTAASQVTPKAQSPTKAAVVPKNTGGQPTQGDAAKAEAARADSIKRAQARADALSNALADSLRQAAAAKAAVKTEPTVARVEAVSPPAADQAAQGKTPYEDNCRKCHGVRGIPPKTMKDKFPKIATFDAAFFANHTADSIVTVLTKGKNADMVSFKDKLSHSEMVAVAAYIRAFVQK
jgi:mono/diheme cytochrome c family protein